jgi:hypothetical protein
MKGKKIMNLFHLHKDPKTIAKYHCDKRDGCLTTPPQCMPDQYKNADYITAYRNYYKAEKKPFAVYTKREVPEFML